MEKISGILPANARTRSVDNSRTQPVRPGAPSLGRPMGRVTQAPVNVPTVIEDRINFSTAEKAMAAQPTTYKNRVEAARSKIVDDLAKKFFEPTPAQDIAGESPKTRELILENFEDQRPVKTHE